MKVSKTLIASILILAIGYSLIAIAFSMPTEDANGNSTLWLELFVAGVIVVAGGGIVMMTYFVRSRATIVSESKESITFTRFGTHYTFYPDRVKATRKDKLIREMYYNEAEKIIYDSRSGWKHTLSVFFGLAKDNHGFSSLCVVAKEEKKRSKWTQPAVSGISVSISRADLEKVKRIVSVPITLI